MSSSRLPNFLRWQVAFTCIASALAFADFADYGIYVFVVPFAVLLLLSALVMGVIGLERLSLSRRAKAITIICMVLCGIQLPDMMFRRLPATFGNGRHIRELQEINTRAFEVRQRSAKKNEDGGAK